NHGRHAEGIAVAADAGDHATDQIAGARLLGSAEAQAIAQGNWPGSHGEDIAANAANPGRRPLIRLDERWVVVALRFENPRLTIADIDHTGVFARAVDDSFACGWQAFEMDARRLIRAVLAPHHRNQAELGEGRHPAKLSASTIIFVATQTVL